MERQEIEKKMLAVHNLTQQAAAKEKSRDLVLGYGHDHAQVRHLLETANNDEILALRAMIAARLDREYNALLEQAAALLK